MRTQILLSVVLIGAGITGCSVGSGGFIANDASGNLTGDLASSIANYQIVDLETGTAEGRTDISDLATNDSYRDRFLVFHRVETAGHALGTRSGIGGQADEVATTVAVPAFYLGVFELTQAQWQRIANSTPWAALTPSDAGGGAASALPAYGVSYDLANAALRGRPFGLPTAVQWEAAAHAGTTTAYAWGDTPDEITAAQFARVAETTALTATATGSLSTGPGRVGRLVPNAFGFYDMAGNVWELTADKNVRGGSWNDPVMQARPANIAQIDQTSAHALVGLRLAIIPQN